MDTADVSSPESVPINSSATSTTSTLPFTQVQDRGTSSKTVWAPARDPVERRHKQTLRPLDHVDSYLPIEKMFSDDTADSRNDNAEDRDRDYEEVVAYMQNQGLYFEDFIGRWNKPGSCWLSDGPKGVVFEDSTDDETDGGLRLDPGGRQPDAGSEGVFSFEEGTDFERDAGLRLAPGGLQPDAGSEGVFSFERQPDAGSEAVLSFERQPDAGSEGVLSFERQLDAEQQERRRARRLWCIPADGPLASGS
ncbi:hypothetical protein Q5P01_000807 [Channa striata]|uniref:Uncharacterized protein n=1 Tax=Channa striata TaxID=64152 RepID=A0AA88IHZ0_CHASR|nr:hypothetical protein Q5P01_000807 [Channa striata]